MIHLKINPIKILFQQKKRRALKIRVKRNKNRKPFDETKTKNKN
jgi:hypothetical protein